MQDIGRVNVLKSSQYLVQKMLQNQKKATNHIMLYKNEDKLRTNAHYYGNMKQQ